MKLIFTLLLLVALTWAQEENKYSRKSISYLNALYKNDASARLLTSHQQDMVLLKLKRELKLPRFDYVPIPEVLVNRVVQRSRQQGSVTLDAVSGFLAEEMAPLIQEALENSVLEKGKGLQEEWQEETFVATKAKSLDLNAEQYFQLMNSAYIFVPLLGDYQVIPKQLRGGGMSYETRMTLGVVWFQVIVDSENKVTVKKLKQLTSKIKEDVVAQNSGHSIDGRIVDAKEASFYKALTIGSKNLVIQTRSMPAFQLKAQVMDGGFYQANVDVGRKEGVHTDDYFRFFEIVETVDGSEKRNDLGWGYVESLNEGDSVSTKLEIISGRAEQGHSLEEIATSGFSMQVSGAYVPLRWEDPYFADSLKPMRNLGGINVSFFHDIAPSYEGNHFYYGLEGGVYFGGSGDSSRWTSPDRIEHKLNSVVEWQGLFLLRKKIHVVNRLFLFGDVGLGFQGLEISTDIKENFSNAGSLSVQSMIVRARLGAELDLTPTFSLSGGVSYGAGAEYLTKYDDGDGDIECEEVCADLDHSGIGIHIGIHWKTPQITSNPFNNLIR